MIADLCCLCLMCAKYDECFENDTFKYCTGENYDNINNDLKLGTLCYSPPECGVDLCSMSCYKAEFEV